MYQPNYEIAYGSTYDKTLSTKEVAKKIREQIKADKKAGNLPKGLKVSVRYKSFSGGTSIDLTVTAVDFQHMNTARVIWENENPNQIADYEADPELRERYSLKGREVLKRLQSLMDGFNYDGSDSMVDYFNVNFYGHANYDWELDMAVRKSYS